MEDPTKNEGKEQSIDAGTGSNKTRLGAVKRMYKQFGESGTGQALGGLTGLTVYGPVALVGMFGRVMQLRAHTMWGKVRGQKLVNFQDFVISRAKPKYEARGAGQGGQAPGGAAPQG